MSADQIVAEHMDRVRDLARRFHANEREDLVQEGLLALLRAAERWEPERGILLWTYASQRVLGAMTDAIRRKGARALVTVQCVPEIDGVTMADEPQDDGERIAVVQGKRRAVRPATCPTCSREFLRRADRRHCSIRCSKVRQAERRCTVCSHAFVGRPRHDDRRCAVCRAARRMPQASPQRRAAISAAIRAWHQRRA